MLKRLVRTALAGGALALAIAGCTAGESADVAAEGSVSTSITSDDPASATVEGSGQPTASDFTILGFDTAVYDVPMPEHDLAEGFPAIMDSDDLIDAGIVAEVWGEAEAVRAIISIVLGELSPDAVPALDQLLHRSHHEVLERAEALLEGDSLQDDVRADLVRLTTFFFGEDTPGPQAAVAGLAPVAGSQAQLAIHQDPGCEAGTVDLGEKYQFRAIETGACFNVTETAEGDIVYTQSNEPDDPAAEVAAFIEMARGGYSELANSVLPHVEVLISPREDPTGDDDEAHTFAWNRGDGGCRIAIYATSANIAAGTEFRFTLAHELFHCIQQEWIGGGPADGFTLEGGANYFAYRLTEDCAASIVAYGPPMDVYTTTNSLLDMDYAGWFFWAFLDEYGHLPSLGIAVAHQQIAEGLAVETVLQAAFPDLPKIMNEFYVRLVGPGLACGFQGEEVTGTIPVDKNKTKIDLDAQLWVGTRYKLDYEEKLLFEQSDPGGGPIGMAKFDSRRDADEWVVVAEEVRTKCKKTETHIAVVTARGEDGEQRAITIDATKEGACDACLLGRWSVDMETLDEFYEASPNALDMELNGSVTFEFMSGDGADTAEVLDQRKFSMTLVGLASPPLNRDGEGTAVYSGDETSLTIHGYNESGTVNILDSSSPFAGVAGGDGSVLYRCDGDELEMSRPGATLFAVRDPATEKGDPYF